MKLTSHLDLYVVGYGDSDYESDFPGELQISSGEETVWYVPRDRIAALKAATEGVRDATLVEAERAIFAEFGDGLSTEIITSLRTAPEGAHVWTAEDLADAPKRAWELKKVIDPEGAQAMCACGHLSEIHSDRPNGGRHRGEDDARHCGCTLNKRVVVPIPEDTQADAEEAGAAGNIGDLNYGETEELASLQSKDDLF